MTDNETEHEERSHLHILQSQVLSVASTVCTKLRPLSSYHWKDTQNAFDSHIYVNIHMCATRETWKRRKTDKFMKNNFPSSEN